MSVSLKLKFTQWISVDILRSPWAIVISAILAAYVGMFYPALSEQLAPVGDLYLGLLKMCVLPILLSAITASIGRLMGSANAKQYIRRILCVFPIGLLLVSSFASAIAFLLGPGRNLSEATLANLGVLVNDSSLDFEVALSGPITIEEAGQTISDVIMTIVPDNIFSALSEGQTLKVLSFSILFGLSLGLLNKELSRTAFELLDSVFNTFNQLMHWLTLILPIGLFSLLSYQLSQQGLGVVTSMLSFVIVTITTFFLIYVICSAIIWQQSRQSLSFVLSALREPTVLALATSSSFACLPSAITTLSETLRLDRQTINLVTPLTITLCRFGSVVYFALASMFVAQLYERSLDLVDFGIVIVGSIFAGMATSGISGILTLTMLGIVLEPLNLPLEAVLVLFISIDPLANPIRTLGNVHTAMAASTIIADVSKTGERAATAATFESR